MRTLLILLLAMTTFSLKSQNEEFTIHDNGLIYSESSMKKLKKVADSLNLKYLECNIDYTYTSISQGRGHYVLLEEGAIHSALRDIQNDIDFESFLSKYPKAKIEKDLLVACHSMKDKDGRTYSDFEEVRFRGYGRHSINEVYKIKPSMNEEFWMVKHHEKNSYMDEYIEAFYFPEGLTSQTIPSIYADKIGYSDCMIDTTSAKILEDAEYGWPSLPDDWTQLSKKEKSDLLLEMRNTRVVGSCSMDSSPRIHARNIALLSSETSDWQVFLKAHLDIMNDRFERMSDGSYAWQGRKTYLQEVEALDINTLDLLFGTLLRIENPSVHHYFSSPGRIGRALTDIEDKDRVEDLMSAMIEDDRLDFLNRSIVYFTFDSYLHHLEDKSQHRSASRKLKKSISSLPSFVREKFVDK